MDGLEAVELKLSEALNNQDFRIDSEFYQKPPITSSKHKWVNVSDVLSYVQYGLSIEMNQAKRGYKILIV